ncbi:hypothetical protein SALBM135S_06242 [Streptomyces alboniger]
MPFHRGERPLGAGRSRSAVRVPRASKEGLSRASLIRTVSGSRGYRSSSSDSPMTAIAPTRSMMPVTSGSARLWFSGTNRAPSRASAK